MLVCGHGVDERNGKHNAVLVAAHGDVHDITYASAQLRKLSILSRLRQSRMRTAVGDSVDCVRIAGPKLCRCNRALMSARTTTEHGEDVTQRPNAKVTYVLGSTHLAHLQLYLIQLDSRVTLEPSEKLKAAAK